MKIIENRVKEEMSILEALNRIDTISHIPDTTPRGSDGMAFRQRAGGGAGWGSATGHEDPSNDWGNEANAYDDVNATYAESYAYLPGDTGFLVLTLGAAITSDKVRLKLTHGTGTGYIKPDEIDVDVYDGEEWHDVYYGTYEEEATFNIFNFSQRSVEKLRVRFTILGSGFIEPRVNEGDFYTVAGTGGELIVDQYEKDRTITVSKTITEYNKGTIAGGAYVEENLDLGDCKEIALSVRVYCHASATDGVRVYLLASGNATHYDDESELDAFGFFDIEFEAGVYQMRTVNVKALPRYLKVLTRNLDSTWTVAYCRYWVTEVK